METTTESFKLLGLSASDSGSDISEFVLTAPRKKKRKRRYRGATSPVPQVKQSSFCYFKGKTIALSIIASLLLCWLIVITWLALMLHGEIRRLDTNVRGVVAGSQGVPDALQKCHSMSRELQQNQTALFTHLAVLSLQTGNFSTQLAGMQNGLQSLEERLKATPELVNVPRDLKELRASVATFGSQISDLETRVTGLKDDYGRLSEASQGLARNLSAALTRLADVSARPQPVDRDDAGERKRVMGEIAQLTANVTSVNQTLTSRLGWLLEDQHKDHTLIEALQNSGQNVSAQVRTLDGECARQSALASLNATVKTLTAKVSNGSALIGALDQQVSLLRSEHEKKMAEQQQQPVAGAVAQPGDAVTDVEPPSQSVTVATRSASPASQPPTPSALEQTAILP